MRPSAISTTGGLNGDMPFSVDPETRSAFEKSFMMVAANSPIRRSIFRWLVTICIVGQLRVSAHHPNWVIVAPEGAGRSAFAVQQTLLSGDRLLDAEADPYDGCLYVLTKSRDSRGSPSPGTTASSSAARADPARLDVRRRVRRPGSR
jgi:hypothetical protein